MSKDKADASVKLSLPADVSSRAQFSEAVRLFLMDCRFRNLSPMTIEGYYTYLRALQRDLDQWGLSLNTLTPKDLTVRMVNEMLEQGFKPNTINGKIRTCQQFFKFLHLEGILDTNLAESLKPIKNERKMVHTFTEEQVQAIMRQPDRKTFTGLRDYTMMLVLLDTGMRVNELTQMKISHIDFEEKTIHIPMGKGRKFRVVPIQQTCVNALKEYLEERGEHEFDDLWVTVFHQPFRRYGVIQMISGHCQKAGINGVQGSAHTFRHTFAKFFLMNGGDIFTLQYLLGHTTLEMTRYYVELFSKDLHKQHEKCSPVEHLAEDLKEEVQ